MPSNSRKMPLEPPGVASERTRHSGLQRPLQPFACPLGRTPARDGPDPAHANQARSPPPTDAPRPPASALARVVEQLPRLLAA